LLLARNFAHLVQLESDRWAFRQKPPPERAQVLHDPISQRPEHLLFGIPTQKAHSWLTADGLTQSSKCYWRRRAILAYRLQGQTPLDAEVARRAAQIQIMSCLSPRQPRASPDFFHPGEPAPPISSRSNLRALVWKCGRAGTYRRRSACCAEAGRVRSSPCALDMDALSCDEEGDGPSRPVCARRTTPVLPVHAACGHDTHFAMLMVSPRLGGKRKELRGHPVLFQPLRECAAPGRRIVARCYDREAPHDPASATRPDVFRILPERSAIGPAGAMLSFEYCLIVRAGAPDARAQPWSPVSIRLSSRHRSWSGLHTDHSRQVGCHRRAGLSSRIGASTGGVVLSNIIALPRRP